ncbi:hypothetical protein BH09VER1_BH09VER1_39960 [soil metagenome]
MKVTVSPDVVRFVFTVCAVAAVGAPAGGLWLAHSSPMEAYRYSTSIWFLWVGGNIGSVVWSIFYLKSDPVLARVSLFAVAFSLFTGACLPRL